MVFKFLILYNEIGVMIIFVLSCFLSEQMSCLSRQVISKDNWDVDRSIYNLRVSLGRPYEFFHVPEFKRYVYNGPSVILTKVCFIVKQHPLTTQIWLKFFSNLVWSVIQSCQLWCLKPDWVIFSPLVPKLGVSWCFSYLFLML